MKGSNMFEVLDPTIPIRLFGSSVSRAKHVGLVVSRLRHSISHRMNMLIEVIGIEQYIVSILSLLTFE